jgi:hypothetical protein
MSTADPAGYLIYYPYSSSVGGGAASHSLWAMLLFAVVFICLIIVFSWAAYVDYNSGGRAGACGQQRMEKHRTVHHWGYVRGGGNNNNNNIDKGGDNNDIPFEELVDEPRARGEPAYGHPPFNPNSEWDKGTAPPWPVDQYGKPLAYSAYPTPSQHVNNNNNTTRAALGVALKPPWSRGASVGDADIHNAIMSSATVGEFFKSSNQNNVNKKQHLQTKDWIY